MFFLSKHPLFPKQKMVVILGAHTCGLEAWCLLFGILGDPPLGAPERPWEQQKGHTGVQSRVFSDFGVIWGPHFDSFSGTEGQTNPVSFSGSFPCRL